MQQSLMASARTRQTGGDQGLYHLALGFYSWASPGTSGDEDQKLCPVPRLKARFLLGVEPTF